MKDYFNSNCTCFDHFSNDEDIRYNEFSFEFIKDNPRVTITFNLDEFLTKEYMNEINPKLEND